jgi:hypothetical protein
MVAGENPARLAEGHETKRLALALAYARRVMPRFPDAAYNERDPHRWWMEYTLYLADHPARAFRVPESELRRLRDAVGRAIESGHLARACVGL